MKKNTLVDRASRPRPRDVDGFAAARDRGLLPVVPTDPPTGQHVSRPTSGEIFRSLLVRLIGSGLLLALLALILFLAVPLPAVVAAVTTVAVGVAWVIYATRQMRLPFSQVIRECRHGYTTLAIASGNPGTGGQARHWANHEGGMPWSFDGVWVLNRRFRVQSEPDLESDPPGMYPSPDGDGLWELWTGKVWSGATTATPPSP